MPIKPYRQTSDLVVAKSISLHPRYWMMLLDISVDRNEMPNATLKAMIASTHERWVTMKAQKNLDQADDEKA